MSKNKGLGQGVGLLFSEAQERLFDCDIDNIIPNKFQPRTIFNAEDLQELADSIREKGIIQPLIVKTTDNEKYALIAGERRLRASKLIGLKTVPVVLMDVEKDDDLLELALIENIQRTDLNAIEEAEAYRKLIEKFDYTQEETARRVGKKRPTITNMLRLLNLPGSIQQDIVDGLLSEGHGRALIKLTDHPQKQQSIRNEIVKNSLSVRATEKLIKKAASNKPQPKPQLRQKTEELPKSYKNSLITQLTNRVNSKVHITENGGRGKIEIEYYSIDDLDRVTAVLLGE
jgi:ParB family chromosome partitioning protein